MGGRFLRLPVALCNVLGNLKMHIPLIKYFAIDYVRIFRFLLIGGLTFVIYYSILWMCFGFASLSYPKAVAISYSVAIIFHFYANKTITFNAERKKFWQQILSYIFVALLNYVLQISVIAICYGIYGVNFYISTFIGVMLTMITGYFLMSFWVFKKKRC
ncbi:MAG: GtrA family protein [Chlorobium sp.]